MTQSSLRWNPLRWLLLAVVFHLCVTFSVFLVGHFQLLPNIVDENGVGVSFALDGVAYRNWARFMVLEAQAKGVSRWFEMQAPLHCRIYSLAFAAFGRLVGYNILTVEPLNLIYYLGILSFVFLLGREIFNSTAGLLAAAMVAVWPTFLLNTTQLIRDPLATLCLLGVMFALTLLLSWDFSWTQTLLVSLGCGVGVTVFWLVRGNMWNVVLTSLAVTATLLIIRMIRERKFAVRNLTAFVFVLLVALTVPSRVQSTVMPNTRPPGPALAIPSASEPTPREGVWERTLNQINRRRAAFQNYEGGRGSSIDTGVRLASAGDLLMYLPRAIAIGFFAPFPNMWFQAGTYGLAMRLVAGAEMLVMYVLYVLAAICLWQERRRLTVWLLFLVAGLGMVGLGLVVANVGALFRLRYALLIMMIVLAAQGALHIMRKT
jgi:hypothetical protein